MAPTARGATEHETVIDDAGSPEQAETEEDAAAREEAKKADERRKRQEELEHKRSLGRHLRKACTSGDRKMVKTLIEQYQADPSSSQDSGSTPLHEAAYAGHTEIC